MTRQDRQDDDKARPRQKKWRPDTRQRQDDCQREGERREADVGTDTQTGSQTADRQAQAQTNNHGQDKNRQCSRRQTHPRERKTKIGRNER
jgi:hypothetical protein